MNEMYKRFKTDKKFNAAVRLSIYTIFIAIVTTYAFANRNLVKITDENVDNNIEEIQEDYEIILSENFKYKIDIKLDDSLCEYIIEKNEEEIQITKKTVKESNNYLLKNNEYYLNVDNKYVLSSEEKVYDVIDNNYLNIDTINNYLKKSTKIDNKYTIYVKDIVLESQNDKYITIDINDNQINVDYTELMKELNIANYSCTVNIEIEE